jgi:glycosyltransferase involved in cell wall biosynthesis
MRQLRIAYLCLQPTTQGQASYTHVYEIVDGLRARGHHVDLYQPPSPETLPHKPSARVRAEVHTQMSLAPRLKTYDVVYVRGHALAFPTSALARRLGIPVVQECNGPYSDFSRAWPGSRAFEGVVTHLARRQFCTADAVVAVTPRLAEWLSDDTGRSVRVVPNGANVALFTNDRPRLPGLPDEYAVFFGALQPWQGISTILAATEHEAWPADLPIVFAGTGLLTPEVQEAAERHPERIRNIGRVRYESVPDLVANAAVSLVGFDTEPRPGGGGSPLKLYESMACGVAVVGSNLPGQVEVINEAECGLVVDPITPGNLARAVAWLRENQLAAREMGERGRQAAVSTHSWQDRAARIAQIVEELVSERRPARRPGRRPEHRPERQPERQTSPAEQR